MKKAVLDGGVFVNMAVITTDRHLFISDKETLLNELANGIINYIYHCIELSGEKIDEAILAIDSKSWRRKFYPQYKSNRANKPFTNGMDRELFNYLITNLPKSIKDKNPLFKLIKINGAEADDIVYVLSGENDVIYGVDKDLTQCNYRKFFNVKEKVLYNKELYDISEHVLRGDASDGIPSCLHGDDHYVNKEKIKRLTRSRLNACLELLKNNNSSKIAIDNNFPVDIGVVMHGIERNRKLIDMSNIPIEIVNEINEAYKKNPIIKYRQRYNLDYLLEDLDI